MVSLIGQPATVSSTVTATAPSSPIETSLTMPSSVMGRRISGSFTVASAALIGSSSGVVMPPGYVVLLLCRVRVVGPRRCAVVEVGQQVA